MYVLKELFHFFILLISLYFCSILYASNFPVQTLDFVVKYTLEQNPNILKSKANLNASKESVKESFGEFLPRVDIRYARGFENTKKAYLDDENIELTRTEKGIYFLQPVFSGLGDYNTFRQRKLEVKAADFSVNDTKELLAIHVVKTYFNILRISELKELAMENVEVHKKTLDKVEKRYKGGGGHKTDVDLAKGRLAQSKTLLESVEVSDQNAKATFIKVVGITPQNLILPTIPEVPQNLIESINIALKNNSSLLKSKAYYDSSSLAVSVAKSKFFPSVNLELVARDNTNVFGIEGGAKEFRGMAVLYYNIFDGGIDFARINRAKQNNIAYLENYEDVKREVIENVTYAWNNFISDKLKLRELKEHVDFSKKALIGYKKQFEMSRRSLLDVLDMENELFRARLDLINGEYAFKVDHYDLLKSIGILTFNIY